MSKNNTDKQAKETKNEPVVTIKQRLVGAIILVSLGIIFIPLILDGDPSQKFFSTKSNIPTIPDHLQHTLYGIPQPGAMPEPEKITTYPITGDGNSVGYQYNSSSAQATTAGQNVILSNSRYEKAGPPDGSQIDTVYAIQIGSFTQKSNALGLRNNLKKKGFKAYVELITTDKGDFYRLRVGPYLQYKQIVNIQKNIKVKFKLDNTVIVKYKTP